jgi:stage V sporulation protein G
VNITEVRISLAAGSDEQLLGFCTLTFDRAFVVRDIRIINGANGPFVAMPSRRVTTNCGNCNAKNYLGSRYCSECGNRLPPLCQVKRPERGRGYVDIAHPINARAREQIQSVILEAYRSEIQRSQQPGYQPLALDVDVAVKADSASDE